ncbi:MAG TPA: DUF4129 domain-containing protein [Myxococcaceae bacterium]
MIRALPLLVLLAAPAKENPDRVQEAMEKAYARGDLQQSYPTALDIRSLESAEAALDPIVALLRWLGLGGVAAQLVRLVGVGVAVLAVLLFVAWLGRRLAERGDSGSTAEGVSAPTLDAGLLLDAEALAAQGRYGEAIHLLLLRTFEVLARRMGSRLAPGMTAREAVARLTLPGPARPALADLVEAAETTTFAGRAASESDYQRCAERFGVLKSALAGARG